MLEILWISTWKEWWKIKWPTRYFNDGHGISMACGIQNQSYRRFHNAIHIVSIELELIRLEIFETQFYYMNFVDASDQWCSFLCSVQCIFHAPFPPNDPIVHTNSTCWHLHYLGISTWNRCSKSWPRLYDQVAFSKTERQLKCDWINNIRPEILLLLQS